MIVVDAGSSIQAALNPASSGDTILVKPGIYRESITVPADIQRLRLIGAGAGRTILDGEGLAGPDGITVEGRAATIAGFTVRNFRQYGILTRPEADGNIIRHNVATANGISGIHLLSARNLVARNRVVKNDFHGIEVILGAHNYIIGNWSGRNGEEGIHLDTPNGLVVGNRVWANVFQGILIQGPGCWVIANKAWRNRQDGILVEAANVLVYGNTSRRNARAGLAATAVGLVAVDNRLVGNVEEGLRVPNLLEGAIIYNNLLAGNGGGGSAGAGTVDTTLLLANKVWRNRLQGLPFGTGSGNALLFNLVGRNHGPGISGNGEFSRNLLDNNRVRSNRGAGIHLGPGAQENAVRSNSLRGNKPFDIVADPPAHTNNTFDLNRCRRSSPEGLCT